MLWHVGINAGAGMTYAKLPLDKPQKTVYTYLQQAARLLDQASRVRGYNL